MKQRLIQEHKSLTNQILNMSLIDWRIGLDYPLQLKRE